MTTNRKWVHGPYVVENPGKSTWADSTEAEHIHAAPASGYLNTANQPTLQAAYKPICLLPGNHDRFGAYHSPGNPNFDSIFAHDWPVGQGVHAWPPLLNGPGGETLILIGVDFTLASGDLGRALLGYLGQGRAYPALADELIDATKNALRDHVGCTVLWAMHFEPETATGLHELLGDDYLGNELQRIGSEASLTKPPVAAILCGHVHKCWPKSFRHTQVYICGTTTQHLPVRHPPSSRDNALQIIEITMQR